MHIGNCGSDYLRQFYRFAAPRIGKAKNSLTMRAG
jgi:hypothetical protein